jgi:hypothetical protein
MKKTLFGQKAEFRSAPIKLNNPTYEEYKAVIERANVSWSYALKLGVEQLKADLEKRDEKQKRMGLGGNLFKKGIKE